MKKHNLMLLFLFSSAIAKDANVEDYSSGKTKILEIMSHEDTYKENNNARVESTNLDKDLNLEAIAKEFPCKTLVGQSFLLETLKNPVKPEEKDAFLLKRQNAVRTLVENPELRKEINELLEKAKIEEEEVTKLLSDYFKGSKCPELKSLESVKEKSPGMYPLIHFISTNPYGKYIFYMYETSQLAFSLYILKEFVPLLKSLPKNHPQYGKVLMNSAFYLAIDGLSIYRMGKDYKNNYDKRKKIHSLNQLILIADNFELLCKEYNIESQFNISNVTDSKGKEFIENLRSRRYINKNTVLFQAPLVHSFLYKMYESQVKLAPAFACIAEIDCYNTIATKILESQNTDNKFCFVNFISNDEPKVETTGFWNILVNNAVPNNIEENKNIILTGPNAGGKTTAIRAILQNIVLGQTYGVAAAETFNFTMFDAIDSYLNVSDDLINGLSLFKSEIKRAQEVLEKVKTLDENKKYFFALDELFTGTVAEDGEACAYQFVDKISSYPRVQFVYATHFNKLKTLGNENPKCANYKVDAPTKNIAGKLVYPFTLSKGANTSRVALDIAKEANLFD